MTMGLTVSQGSDASRMKDFDAGQLNMRYGIIFISCSLKRRHSKWVLISNPYDGNGIFLFSLHHGLRLCSPRIPLGFSGLG